MAYTEETIEACKEKIILEIGNGKSLSSILKKDETLPSRQTVYNWFNSNHADYDKVFLDNYTRAREDSADIDAENVAIIAKKVLKGTYGHAEARVAIDAIKWSAGVKQPTKYGAKIDLTSKGNELQPTTIKIGYGNKDEV